MSFSGFDENGSELYDTKEAAIERAKMLARHHGIDKVMIARTWAPTWLAHLFRETPIEFLFYTEVK